MGTHKSVDGAETLGVGGLNLPMKKDKHRANFYSRRVQQAIHKKQIKRSSRRKRKRGRAGRRLARAAARLSRERQKAALVKVATNNVRSLSAKGANGYGRDEVVLHEAAAKNMRMKHYIIKKCWGSRKREDQGGKSLQQQDSVCSTAVLHQVGNMA